MIRRAWILPFHDDETPGGYCSRLAAWNGCTGVWDFCLDMGLSYSRVVDGDEEALKGLSVLTGAALDALKANSFVNLGQRLFKVRGETVIAANSRRGYIRVCPECLAADSAGNPFHGTAAPYQRVHWQLSWFRSCPVHGVALQVVEQKKMAALLDFSNAVKPMLNASASGRIDAVAYPTSELQRYMATRLYGGRSAVTDVLWLSDLPLHKAARLCEVLGSVSLFGPNAAIKGMDEAAVAAVGAAGFKLLSAGPQAVQKMLGDLMSEFWKTGGRVAVGKLLGLLHSWLQDEGEDADLEPIRDFVSRELQSKLPVEHHSTIFGKPALERKVWSIYSAAQEFPVNAKQIRKFLTEKGVIDSNSSHIPDEMVIFSIDEVSPILESIRFEKVGRSPRIDDYTSRRRKPEEIKNVKDAFCQEVDSSYSVLTVKEAARRMKWGTATVLSLIKRGILNHTVFSHPNGKKKYYLVNLGNLDEFSKKFISFRELKCENISTLKSVNINFGIKPAIESKSGSGTFYRRSDLGM